MPRGRREQIRKGPAASGRRFVLLVLLVLALLALPVVGVLVYVLASSRPPKSTEPVAVKKPILFKPGKGLRLSEALRRATAGDHFILQGDIEEDDISITQSKIILEAEEGKTVIWKPRSATRPRDPKQAPGSGEKLLKILGAEGVQVRGITFDGDNRADVLVGLYGRCGGTKLERLQLRNPGSYGLHITNCVGSPEAPVLLHGLAFDTPAGKTAVFFEIFSHSIKTAKVNDFIHFTDCTFTGQGFQVRGRKETVGENVTLPQGVKVEMVP